MQMLCGGGKAASTTQLVRSARGWSAANGLGTLGEFAKGLRQSELALYIPSGSSESRLQEQDDLAEEEARWGQSLPFSHAAAADESLSDAHTRGVQGAVRWLQEGDGPGSAPRGAWKDVWRSFCSSIVQEEEEDVDTEKENALWEEVVAWHAAVHRKDRATVAKRWALNLEAAAMPPLRRLPPSGLL